MSGSNVLRQLSNGKWAYCVDAMIVGEAGSQPRVGMLALLCKDLQEYGARGESVSIAQFYELVIPGTILTRHIFSGLNRPLLTDDDSEADEKMIIYTRKPAYDYVWAGGPHGGPRRMDASPTGKVFAVITMPNGGRHREAYPEVDGWVNAWTWLEEDPGLSEAPIKWVDRYKRKLWTREGG